MLGKWEFGMTTHYAKEKKNIVYVDNAFPNAELTNYSSVKIKFPPGFPGTQP